MRQTRRIRVRAHAKINLSLRVAKLRDDGYHELETVFQALALHDGLTVRLHDGPFTITCDDPGVPTDSHNLVWRAAQCLWERCGRGGAVRGVEIALAKQIPMQAGLGGGSSDAAAAIVALARLWAVKPGIDLAAIGAEVGADVPYFLIGGTALGLSRGDDLYPLPDLPVYQVVLGLPAFGVSTAEAYGWFDRDASASRVAGGGRAVAIPAWPGRPLAVHNDLEAPVVVRHPQIGELRDLLVKGGACAAAMTGSGSAVFGLFASEVRARAGAQRVAAAGFVALMTETIGRRRGLRAAVPSSRPRLSR
ncbi:MAG: 4-(cytidine 5'-diphospho)-2-C-methyl-D-erythritol kinase [Acidobacteriota bacterium]